MLQPKIRKSYVFASRRWMSSAQPDHFASDNKWEQCRAIAANMLDRMGIEPKLTSPAFGHVELEEAVMRINARVVELYIESINMYKHSSVQGLSKTQIGEKLEGNVLAWEEDIADFMTDVDVASGGHHVIIAGILKLKREELLEWLAKMVSFKARGQVPPDNDVLDELWGVGAGPRDISAVQAGSPPPVQFHGWVALEVDRKLEKIIKSCIVLLDNATPNPTNMSLRQIFPAVEKRAKGFDEAKFLGNQAGVELGFSRKWVEQILQQYDITERLCLDQCGPDGPDMADLKNPLFKRDRTASEIKRQEKYYRAGGDVQRLRATYLIWAGCNLREGLNLVEI